MASIFDIRYLASFLGLPYKFLRLNQKTKNRSMNRIKELGSNFNAVLFLEFRVPDGCIRLNLTLKNVIIVNMNPCNEIREP